MTKALYRKYRSKSLSEIIGQNHVTDILSRAIAQNKISHAYLLTGPRGVGKTSIARILAHEINNLPYGDDETHLDIIEIDAASNNGVEDVRDLREKVQVAPVSAPKKIYIIDEVHMLTKSAFNALLKTLEEPPEHVVFILATTDIDKLPATIISRTQRFTFRSIGLNDAVLHLKDIAQKENIKISDQALKLIAERGDGSFRDSISLLDQLSSLSDKSEGITDGLVETALGLAPAVLIESIIDAIKTRDLLEVVKLLDSAHENGISPILLAQQLTFALREHIKDNPTLLQLLDGLLDVAKSSQPEVKLLTVIGLAITPKIAQKTVALAAPVHEVTATIAELEMKAIESKPVDKITKDKTTAAVIVETHESEVTKIIKSPDLPTQASKKVASVKSIDSTQFDFKALVEHTRQNYVAIYSVLSKCQYDLHDGILVLYTNSKFYKNKLDDIKYSTMVHESLAALGLNDIEIETVPTAPPPKDSQAAAVAAIMGGGEEIEVE